MIEVDIKNAYDASEYANLENYLSKHHCIDYCIAHRVATRVANRRNVIAAFELAAEEQIFDSAKGNALETRRRLRQHRIGSISKNVLVKL